MARIQTAKDAIRRIWSFSKALDLALVDEEIQKGLQIDIGYRHGEKVGYLCLRLGELIGIRGKELFLLLIGGLMHDIGAVGGFAQYHGDYRLMQKHSELGAKILEGLSLGETLVEAIRYHHQTPGDHQSESLMAKIIAFADKLDIIMTTKRDIYKEKDDIVRRMNSLVGEEVYPEVFPAFHRLTGEEAFWLDLEGDLLEATLDFLFKKIDDAYCFESEEICNLIQGPSFTVRLAETFAALIDQKSAYTGRHSRSVAETATKLSEGLGWSREMCQEMRLAGLLHDLGKLAVPRKILDKEAALDAGEARIIRTHTYYSYHLLQAAGFSRNIVEWAAYHHERLDGQGYPFHLAGELLPVGARIMTIADMFVALTEDRPYRAGLSKEEALAIVAGGIGKNVDGELVEAAREILL
ncbi:MAG TPA: HD domain-containing protein [Peptococcaceae bacterium]|nr:HD domain-containing protein [Peptococcaceae bacterium]